MEGRPLIFRVIDEEDDYATMRVLQDVARLDRGRILVSPTPDGRGGLHWIARDVLASMGKRADFAGAGRNANETWLRCHLWAAAEGVTDVFVARAHLLAPANLTRLMQFGSATGASVWLIQHAVVPRRAQEAVLDGWGPHDLTVDEFVHEWSQQVEPASDGIESHPFPEVPRDEFTSFRASCRALLPRSDFRRVDELFTETVRTTEQRLRGAAARRDELLAVAREHCGATACFEEALTRLRGIQVAAFRSGLLMRVDLASAAAGWSTTGQPISEGEMTRRVRWYADPRRAAVAAVASTGALGPAEIAAMTVGSALAAIDPEASGPSLPRAIRPLVAVQVLSRSFDGAGADDPLFIGEDGDGHRVAATPRGIQRLLRHVTRETGLLFPGSSLTARHADDGRWAKHAGVEVVGL
jgi:hypothetical protein